MHRSIEQKDDSLVKLGNRLFFAIDNKNQVRNILFVDIFQSSLSISIVPVLALTFKIFNKLSGVLISTSYSNFDCAKLSSSNSNSFSH